ncbi:MAG: hypothetical protein ABI678_02500 [Kofleriaceae bacterium]
MLATACGVTAEDESTDSAEQALGPSCVIQRPYAWHANSGGVGATCFESVSRQFISLAPGESETFFASSTLSHGSVTVVCHLNGDGLWDDIFKSCYPGKGGPQP